MVAATGRVPAGRQGLQADACRWCLSLTSTLPGSTIIPISQKKKLKSNDDKKCVQLINDHYRLSGTALSTCAYELTHPSFSLMRQVCCSHLCCTDVDTEAQNYTADKGQGCDSHPGNAALAGTAVTTRQHCPFTLSGSKPRSVWDLLIFHHIMVPWGSVSLESVFLGTFTLAQLHRCPWGSPSSLPCLPHSGVTPLSPLFGTTFPLPSYILQLVISDSAHPLLL